MIKEFDLGMSPAENNNTIDPGWNRVKADGLTLGELFLMAGAGGGSNVIELCYTWLPKHEGEG